VQAWAASTDAKPDLLIVDYRLPEQLTGIDAIRALRARFGPELPAIMVTGSTMTGHEEEARDFNFHVLIKPVVPTKLRAMIAFKLGVRPA
jgi:CheY-like chemotaxis protein